MRKYRVWTRQGTQTYVECDKITQERNIVYFMRDELLVLAMSSPTMIELQP